MGACFQVPGYGAKQITVTGSPSYVAISLEKDGQTVVRHVSLPEGLDPAALNAVCTDGLLSIGYSKDGLRHRQRWRWRWRAATQPTQPQQLPLSLTHMHKKCTLRTLGMHWSDCQHALAQTRIQRNGLHNKRIEHGSTTSTKQCRNSSARIFREVRPTKTSIETQIKNDCREK